MRVAAAYGTVTSSLRTVEHNRRVGGVRNSWHLTGRAIDVVRFRGVSHVRLAAQLRRAGFALIESIDEGDHSHFAFGDIRGKTDQDRVVGPAAVPPPPEVEPQTLNRMRLAADEQGDLLSKLLGPSRGAKPRDGAWRQGNPRQLSMSGHSQAAISRSRE